jgi:hypothetical protein
LEREIKPATPATQGQNTAVACPQTRSGQRGLFFSNEDAVFVLDERSTLGLI